ncbi:MAG: hypothetical protein PHH06_04725 [Candidatus Gracilibacteria bacterium]|nr:hypothetical protein [Candidatus Gracilibacteria bacterium]
MVKLKDLMKFVLLTIFFSIVIFIINYTFFTSKELIIEENYIDPVSTENKEIILSLEKETQKNILKEEKKEVESLKYLINYLPKTFGEKIKAESTNIETTIKTGTFYNKITSLAIEFYEDRPDVRGKMKSKTIKLFGAHEMGENETLSVFIHEFAHFIDIYFLETNVSIDLSNKFYEISWESTKVMKQNQTQADFVSGYSMTNKYEDMAESFTYYVLHNSDFLEKTKSSSILKQKYDFFTNYLFRNKEFFKTDFSTGDEIKSYYWDITKIDIDLQNFLQYLKK